MPGKEISLSEQLFSRAREYSTLAKNPKLTDDRAATNASQHIGIMLSQLPQEAARQEYLRIKQNSLLTSKQIAKEKGPEAAAKFLFGHAVAASVLETMSQLESGLDQGKLAQLAESITTEIKKALK